MSAGEGISGACVINMLVVDGAVIIVSRSPCARSPLYPTNPIHLCSN